MRTSIIGRLPLLLAPILALAEPAEVMLVQGGQPRAAIVISAEPAGCVPYAARELQVHIEKMSGAVLPVVQVRSAADAPHDRALVLLGESACTRELGLLPDGLAPDGFRIRVAADRLVILGRDDPAFAVNFRFTPVSTGTLYGAYRLLERLGVRWYYPTELGTVIPDTGDIRVGPLSIDDAPTFPYRHTGYGTDAMFAWHRRTGAGGDRDVWSTRHTYEAIGFHKKHGEAHPEYFGIGHGGRRGTAVALAHPGVVEATVVEAKARFSPRRLPGCRYFLVIPADGRGCCQCELCQGKLDSSRGPEGDMSDYVAEAAVKVAEALQGHTPAGLIVYCAYSRYKLVPEIVSRLPSNMVVLIAQPRGGFTDESKKRAAYDLVRGWQELGPAAVYFCRYANSTIKMTPSCMPHLIADDLKALKGISEGSSVRIGGEMNFCGIPADSPYSWWFHLNSYVTARALWNPDLDVDALLEEHCRLFYGPGAGDMRRLLARCEELYGSQDEHFLYRVKTIDELDGFLQAARTKTEGTVYGRRTAWVSECFELVRGMKRKLLSATGDTPVPKGEGLALYLPFNEGSGGTTLDVVGGTECDVRNAGWVEGRKGKALELTGEDSCVRLPLLSLADTDYSISAWIRPAEIRFTGTQYILGPTMWSRQCLIIRDGRLMLFHRSPANRTLAAPSREFTDGVWVHVAGTFSRKNGMSLYIDGNLAALDMAVTEPSRFNAAFVGASGDGRTKAPADVGDCFKGAIDDVRIYRRELSYAEVRRLAGE